ncbi:MAG: cytochrome c [Armatimonadetes bacterium]|nr:cytochrome c [Armatimonadota bacterium]
MTPLLSRLSSASVLLAAAVAFATVPPAPKLPPVTWAKDIAPIINQSCAECHHPGGPGPFPLLTYADARRRARQIAQVTGSRFMPPWLPEPGSGPFVHARRLPRSP